MGPPILVGLRSKDIWLSNLIDIIRAIMQIPPRQPTHAKFSFELTNEAAEKNYLVLMHKYRGNLVALLESQPNSTMRSVWTSATKTPFPTYLHTIPIGIE
jgi:hypothetical protein